MCLLISCGAMTHDVKTCMDRPRKIGAKFTNKFIAPDEKIETFELDYDGKRDRWNGYDSTTYSRVIDSYEMRDEHRRKFQKEQQLKRLEQKNSNPETDKDKDSDDDEDEDEDKDGGEVDEAKVDESQQMDFAKVEKRVRTTGGGSTGTVRYVSVLFCFVLFCFVLFCLYDVPLFGIDGCLHFEHVDLWSPCYCRLVDC